MSDIQENNIDISDLKEPEINYSLLSVDNWKKLGKFVTLNVITGIVIACFSILILSIFGTGVLNTLFVILLYVVSLMIMLGSYEKWRGCRFKK